MTADRVTQTPPPIKVFCPCNDRDPLRSWEMKRLECCEEGRLHCSQRREILAEAAENQMPQLDRMPESRLEGRLTARPIDHRTHLSTAVAGMSAEKLARCLLMEILAQGGGIYKYSSVTCDFFRKSYDKSKKLLDYLCCFVRVTTVEAKSGYGLEWETEASARCCWSFGP